jgi:predicted nuclease with TOPRIM domain
MGTGMDKGCYFTTVTVDGKKYDIPFDTTTVTVDASDILDDTVKEYFKNMSSKKERKMKGKKEIDKHIDRLEENVRLTDRHINRLEDTIMTLDNRMDRLERGKDLKPPSNDMSALESRIDILEHPMGRIEQHDSSLPAIWYISRWIYIFANKKYEIPEIGNSNIASFRKKGDYVEIRWLEHGTTSAGEEVAEAKTRTFLLKDTLIPIDAVYDFGDTPWVEVEK